MRLNMPEHVEASTAYQTPLTPLATSEHPYPAGQPPKAAVPCKVFSGTRQPPCLA